MSNTISSLTAANSIDPVNDYLPIDTANLATTQKINRNTLLGLGSAPVGLTDSQTLTNKILTSPMINGATLSGTLSGTYTIGGTPTFPSSVVTLTGTQALTNKTLTSPTITAPTITNAAISADTLTGFTVSNNGTVYGMSVTGGILASAALANSVNTAALQTNAVGASNLTTSAIKLGYTQITADVTSTAPTSVTQVTGLTVTVTIPSGGRSIKITVYSRYTFNTGANQNIYSLWDGVVGSGTQVSGWYNGQGSSSGQTVGMCMMAVLTPAVGSKTYNVGIQAAAGNVTTGAASTSPAFILVEAI